MRSSFFVWIALTITGGALVVACGSSNGGGTSSGASSTSGATSSGTTTSSSSSGSSGGAPDCATYCAAVMQSCTGGDGSAGGGMPMPDATKTNQQYTGMEQCMASCKAFPVGTIDDKTGNTLGCRQHHATLAAMDPKVHCPHAGPGGDGVCGSTCEGYCEIAKMYCTAANMAQVYKDDADCKATCAATKDDVHFNLGTQGGDHVACLLYHVQEGSVAPPDHCIGDLAKQTGAQGGSVTCH